MISQTSIWKGDNTKPSEDFLEEPVRQKGPFFFTRLVKDILNNDDSVQTIHFDEKSHITNNSDNHPFINMNKDVYFHRLFRIWCLHKTATLFLRKRYLQRRKLFLVFWRNYGTSFKLGKHIVRRMVECHRKKIIFSYNVCWCRTFEHVRKLPVTWG